MHCDYFEAGRCGSCTLIRTPYELQLADKAADAARAVPTTWASPVASAVRGFRTKAKMVVGGTVDVPTLGILDPEGFGQDLQGCLLYPESLSRAFTPLTDFITRSRLEPYDVPARRGELKNVLLTVSPDGRLMIRFVMRSTEALARIRKHLPGLIDALPGLDVVTVNVLPAHAALSEGDTEIVLTDAQTLGMRINDVDLHLGPRSFFQTNTDVASALYREVRGWVAEVAPSRVWDLYCGVGAFALHCTADGRVVTGVEVADAAVAAAQTSATASGVRATFIAADATAWALAQPGPPELVIVNPPRRGIGGDLATWLEDSGVPTVVYSSCNPESLVRDLELMPSLRPVRGRLFDMFPHTAHSEVAVLLQRA